MSQHLVQGNQVFLKVMSGNIVFLPNQAVPGGAAGEDLIRRII